MTHSSIAHAAGGAAAGARLDVRMLAPRERHSTIFAAFRGLPVGDTLELLNDHDPLPLYHQLQAQAPGGFSWAYLERGPALWKVAIRRLAVDFGDGQCCGHCGGGH